MPKGDKTTTKGRKAPPTNSVKGKDRLELAIKEYIKGMYIDRDHKYSWTQALLDAGYSDTYARSRCTELYKRAKPEIDKAKTSLLEEQKYNLEDWELALRDFHKRCIESADMTNEKGAIDMGIKLNQGYINVTMDVTKESPIPEAEQAQITEAAKELTVKLARNTA